MASHRAIHPDLIPIGDLYQYNGPFPCPTQPPYNRRRNTNIPLDVPFDPSFLAPEIADALNTMLSSTAAPSGPIATGGFMQAATADEINEVADWFLPINGQEDNLAGLGGNWDYVKWNAMVVACYLKQMQLGPNLRSLVRVHPPIELYCECDDKKVIRAGIMGKTQFEELYGREDAHNPKEPHKRTSGRPVKITAKKPKGGGGEDKDKDKGGSGGTEVEKGGGTGGGEGGEGDGEGGTGGGEDDGDVEHTDDSEDESGDDVPEWRRLRPAPIGTTPVPHPLTSQYGPDAFLPTDSTGRWVPVAALPNRDLMTLIDPDDPLYGILSRAAQELINEGKDKRRDGSGTSGVAKKKKTKKKPVDGGDGGGEGDTGTTASRLHALRATKNPRTPSPKPKSGYGGKKTSSSEKSNGILHRVGSKFARSGLRMAGSGTDATPAPDPKIAAANMKTPWERFHSDVGGRGPDFRRRQWPSLKKDLGKKRWHIIPVACDVNGELRWWLLVIDMQVQRRTSTDSDKTKDASKGASKDTAKDGAKDGDKDGAKGGADGPARCIWVYNPCSPPSKPTGDVFERFLSEVPRYLYSLASHELFNIDHHTTPVSYPRTSDAAGLDNLRNGTLSAAEYDHPGRFKRFGSKVTVNGNRYNWNNRNPQTGVEVIHAMGRVLLMIELEDARLGAMWKTMGGEGENLRCSTPAAVATAATLRDLEILQESNDTMSFQNRVRTETMVEVQRFMDWTQLRGYPFHEETPDTIPAEGYDVLNHLYKNHADVWRQVSQWFDQGSHAVVVGMDLDTDPRHVVSIPLALGSMIVLHGRKGRNPADDPNLGWWESMGVDGDDTGIALFDTLPDDDLGKQNPGYLYRRYRHLKEDYHDNGSMPSAGGPKDPTNILEKQYPQSMVSLSIDRTGRGIIHVGNRPNGVWRVNGVLVKQSEVIARFSHVTHLYGNSMHWLFIRRFATSKSENVRMQNTVHHDIQSYRRKNRRGDRGETEYMPDDPIWAYPRHTYPNELYKKFNFDLGRDTPHFHHHHRPKKGMGREEQILWESYNNSSNAVLCQNPACLQHSNHTKDKAVPAPNDTSRPCFNTLCVADKHETQYYGNTTCTDISRRRCLPNIDGVLGGHVPGIPGHMFVDNGVLLFRPEMLVTSSDENVDTQGVISRAKKSPPEDAEEIEDLNALPLPPLYWNRVVFTPVGRFPSTTAAREYLRRNFNYEPMLVAEGENSGIAYDLTTYEQLNYYRLLMWNQVDPEIQKGWWREQEFIQQRHGFYTKYDVNGWSETSFRIGYRPDLHPKEASGTAGVEENTMGSAGNPTTIVGTGDPYAWDHMHGRLPVGTLPWDVPPADDAEAHERLGYSSAASLFEDDIAPDPTGATGTRSARNLAKLLGDKPTDVFDFLKRITLRQPFDEVQDYSLRRADEEAEIHHEEVKGNGDREQGSGRDRTSENKISKKSEGSAHGDPGTEANEERVSEPNTRSLRAENAGRAIPPHQKHAIIQTPASQAPKRQNKISPGNRGIKDMDGNEIIIEPTDMLLPKTRLIPCKDGVIEEQYIQIKRQGLNDPILLPVKRSFIRKDEEVGSEKEEEDSVEGVPAEEVATDNNALAKSHNKAEDREQSPAVESRPEKPKAPIPGKRDAENTQLKESDTPSKKVRAKSNPTILSPVAEQPEQGSQPATQDIVKEVNKTIKSAPTTKTEKQKVTKRKRKDEDTSYEAPATLKKRGPKPGQKRKKKDEDDLAYNDRKADKELLKEDRELDRVEPGDEEQHKTDAKATPKQKLPRMLREMQ
ncbi:hypothetical protein TWF281_003861 [Arthrobotrys megalospora]